MKKDQHYLKKLFLTYSSILLLILTVIFLAAMLFLYGEQYRKHTQVQVQLTDSVQKQVDSSLQEMDRIINGLLFNKTFIGVMKNSAATSYADYSDLVLQDFIALDAPLLSTYRIIAFNEYGYYTLTKTAENPALIRAAIKSYPWQEALAKTAGRKLILPPHPDCFDDQQLEVYSVVRTISDGRHSYGVIEVQNLYSQLEDYCTLTEASGQVILYAENGEIIYPADTAQNQDQLFQKIYTCIKDSGLTAASQRMAGQQLSYCTSKYSGWTTVVYSPISSFVPFGIEMIVLLAGIFVFLSGLCLIMIRIITKRMAAPLTQLNKAVSQVTLEHMAIDMQKPSNIVEINNIYRTFTLVLDQLREAIARNVQARANEERANFLALQAQMNPHTLYNTISMIESVSYMNGDKEVSALCIAFSQMLRYISDYEKNEYTIADELGHLDDYATLIKKRYEGKLDIEVALDPALAGLIIPKFTIQPLVENSVKHGFHAKVKHFTITVQIETIPGGWHLRVCDNGSGFSPETLQMISAQLEKCDENLKGQGNITNASIGNLGLGNIYIRCRILYGTGFHMQFGNRQDLAGGYVDLAVTKEETDDPNFSG